MLDALGLNLKEIQLRYLPAGDMFEKYLNSEKIEAAIEYLKLDELVDENQDDVRTS